MKATLILFLMSLIPFLGWSQQNRDFETWSSATVAYELNKKWKVALEEQLRLKDNSSVIDQYFTQLGIERNLWKDFELALGLRYIRNNDTRGRIQGYEDHFRFHVDAGYKHKISQLSVKYRLRYQNRNELGVTVQEGDYPNRRLRFRTALEYKIKNWKLDPFLSAEIFRDYPQNGENKFSRYRLTFGTEYKFEKAGSIGVYYRLEEALNVVIPEITDILRLQYTYTIERKKKK